jgi:endonuclease-3
MNTHQIHTLFDILKAKNPAPTTELIYHNIFQLLIAVILSARATDVSVNRATRVLFELVKTPRDILSLGEENLKKHIKSIGLYPSKARHIMKTCEILCNQYHEHVPHTREALESLPGVGRKTANVILNTAFGEPCIAVDTHIFRVSRRIGLSKGTTVLAVEKELNHVIPEIFKKEAHHWLILHGRYLCQARKPQCEICPIKEQCEYPNKAK